MSEKKILTIGLELASTDTHHESFRSNISLLDWDIILFKPEIDSFVSKYDQSFQGKPALDDSQSFHLKECCEHWRSEIKQAVEIGKTVLVFLSSLYEVHVATGERSYSGTGRNRQTTRIVEPYNNYKAIPASLAPVPAAGSSMKLSPKGAEALIPYWSEFESASTYQVILTNSDVPACVLTRTGDKTVGAIYRSQSSLGTLLLLPDIDFYPDNFIKEKGTEQTWTPAATKFGARMVTSVVALDKALRATSEVTPEPAWVTEPRFTLGPEAHLRVQLLDAEKQVEHAQKQKEKVVEVLSAAGTYRRLLYEKGKPLEGVIIDALRLLGFKAVPFKESDSEFDVVFESNEGRLIGEAEGKDNKPVNVDKLRQLAMNVHEDLQREEVSAPAKPVLFGNGFRLQPLEARSDPFTQKCQSAAASSSTALVFTPDLFPPVQYLITEKDSGYSQSCREAILNSVGRVTFPKPPERDLPQEVIKSEEAK